MTRRFSDYFSDIIGEQKSLFEEQEPVFRRSSSLQMLDSLPFTVEDNNHQIITGSNNKQQLVLPVQLENHHHHALPAPNVIVNNVESPPINNNNNQVNTPTQRIVIKQHDAELQQQQGMSMPYTSTSDMILREVLSNPQLAAQVLNLMLKQPLQQQPSATTPQVYAPNYFLLPQATNYVQNQIQAPPAMMHSPVMQQQHHQHVVSSPPPATPSTSTKFIPSHYEHHHQDEMEAKKLKPIKRDPKEAYILVRGARKSVFCDLAQMEVLNSLPYKYCFKLVLPFSSESDYHYALNNEHIKFELLCHENEKEYVVDKGIVAEKLMRSKMFADRRELEYKVYLSAYSHGFNRNAFIIRLADSQTNKVLLQTNEILIYARRNKSGGNGAHGDTTTKRKRKDDADGNASPSKKQKV